MGFLCIKRKRSVEKILLVNSYLFGISVMSCKILARSRTLSVILLHCFLQVEL